MAYTRRALSGIQSRAPGRYISRRAFGDVLIEAPKRAYRSGEPRWYGAMQGSSLGGSTLGDDAAPDPSDNAMHRIELVLAKGIAQAERQKWLQIAATLSIPLAAAIWKWILNRRGPADITGSST